ncbi:MAG: choice-of-anchor L domain-containing protein [Flavobacterium sp.]
MKKITLMLFIMVFSLAAYAQLPLEKFDTWPVGAGGWAVYQNDAGTAITWGLSPLNSTATPPYSAPHAAYLNRENVPTGNPEDWLVTKDFVVPVNAELRFYTRLVQGGGQGNIFDVKIAPVSTNPTGSDLTAYTSLIDSDGWTEDEMLPGQQLIYAEKVIQIPASYVGQTVRIAFWMKAPSLNGDRWLVDDVSVQTRCLPVLTPTATAPTLSTANLSWNPNGSTTWEIEVIPQSAAPTGVGVTYSGPLPYQPVLDAGTCYKYYVRAICSGGNPSNWSTPVSFCTVPYGATCAAPRVVTPMPFSETGTTAPYGSNYNGAPGAGCGTTGNFLAGNEVVYSYTAAFTGNISISMTGNGANSGMFVYTSCANIGTQCAAGGVGNATTPVNVPLFPVTQGQTYYVVISTSGSTLTTPYTLTIQQVNCQAPANVSIAPSDGSAQLTWTAAGATAWQYFVDAAGGPIPSGAGIPVSGTPTVNAPDLSPGTNYQYWVRADCGNGTFSAWAGPYTFQTTFCPPAQQCNYTFVLRDSFGGWEGAVLTVRQNGVVVATLNLPSGTGPTNVNVPLCHGVPFELRWDVAGSFPNEVGIAILNPFAQTIFTKPINTTGNVGSMYSGVVDCLNPMCLAPTGLAVVANSITTTSVDLKWDGPATGTWQYILLPEGSPAPAADATGWVATTANPTTGITIEPNSSYVAYLRLVCAATSENSPITAPIFFHSGQIPAPLEYSQDFELPANGFARNNATQANKWVAGTAASNGGTTGMYISNNGGAANAYNTDVASVTHIYRDLQIPALGAATAQELGITFDWRAMGEGPSSDYLRVWLVPVTFNPVPGTQISAASGGQQVVNVLNQNGSWTTSSFTVNSTAYAGQARRLVFEWRNTATNGQQPPAAIDNINVQVITCRVPTALALVANSITTTSAQVTWVAPTNSGTPTYDYYLSTSSTVPQEATEPTQSNIATAGTTLTTLEPSTTYYFWVRSNCGASGASFWVGPLVIITPQIPATLNWEEPFEVMPPKWTLNNGTQVNKWVIGGATNNGGANSMYVTSDNGTTNSYSVSSQSVVQAYRDIQIPAGAAEIDVTFDWKSVGDANDYFRVWLVPIEFNPVAGSQITNAAGRQPLGANFFNGGDWTTVTYTADVSTYAGQVRRLVYEWRNNATLGVQTPAAIDNINVKVVTCRKPQNLAAPTDDITQTSAILGWTPMNSETSWDVVVQLPNLPAPTAATVGTPVPGTLPTFLATGLESGTTNVFYVRANCGGANGSSSWAGPFTFVTKIANDDCVNAKLAVVNAGTTCILKTAGTVNGATASAENNTCAGNDNDDVWFKFTAGSPANGTTPADPVGYLGAHEISLTDIVGTNSDFNFTVYSGADCGTMTQFACSTNNTALINNFVAGNTYYIRVYTAGAAAANTTFNVCITSPPGPITSSQTLYTVDQLVRDIFIDNDCVDVQNIQFKTGPSAATNGIAYFNQADSDFGKNNWPSGNAFNIPNLPNGFRDGIVLVTGSAANIAAGMPALGSGVWDNDVDETELANLVGVTPADVHDSSWISFDFVPLGSQMNFDFIFASDEYNGGSFECNYSDVFAFILTDINTGTVSNLAVVPGTTTPILVTNIHPDNTSCDAVNEQFFGQYNNGPYDAVNVNGMTKNLRATSPVVAGHVYKLKMIIANEGDHAVPAAVFLRGGSFNVGEAATIGGDLTIANGNALCIGQNVTINTGLNPADYEFIWRIGTSIIPGQTGPSLNVTQPGNYSVEVSYIGSICSETLTKIVEFYPAIADVVGTPTELVQCSDTGFATFNLALNTPVLLNGLTAANYTVTYFATQQDAENNVIANALPLSYLNTVQNQQTIYVRVLNHVTNCAPAIKSFVIKTQANPQFTVENDFSICVGGTSTINVTAGNWGSDTVTYEWTFNGPVIPTETGASLTVTAAGVYTVKVTNGNCFTTKTVTVTEVAVPVVDEPVNVAACTSYTLPALTTGSYYTATNGGGTMLPVGTAITQTQPIYVYAAAGTNNQCFDEHMFTVTIHTTPVVVDMDDVAACNSYTLPAITVGNYFTGPAGTGTMLNAGDVITTEQTVYIYAQSGTTPNCTDEDSFAITLTTAPVITDPADVAQCSPYTLPALTLGNYYTGPNGTGTMLNAGEVISTPQTIYVFQPGGSPICDAQQDFFVNIIPQPNVVNPGNVTACSSYTLPALSVGNYFTATGGTGTMLNAGDVISTNQTIYIYAQSGTTPNCTDEEMFTVTITTPVVATFSYNASYCQNSSNPLPQLDGVAGTFSSTAGLVINPTTGEIDLAQSTAGTYEIRNTVAANGACPSFFETATVTVGAVPTVVVDQGCDGNAYVLAVNFDGDEVYTEDTVTLTWKDPSGNTLSSTEASVTVTAIGTYSLIVTPNAASACEVTLPVPVTDTTCTVQRGISPNNDGKNDNFDLTALGVTKLSIFNRYGQEVFTYGAYTNQWHGQGKGGDELPTGTYFYSFKRANGEEATGWVYINREE